MNAYYSAPILYKRLFDASDLEEKSWTIKIDSKSADARAPCFCGGSVEELFYCEDQFRTAMHTLGKDLDQYFDQWEDIIMDTAKAVWL